jgi:hypothetical protein
MLQNDKPPQQPFGCKLMDRQVNVLLADEMTASLVGKITLTGIYTSDIFIPVDPFIVPQLVFLFSFETDFDHQFQSVQVQITLPGNPPAIFSAPTVPVSRVPEGHTRLVIRHPFLVQQAILRPGHITAKVIHAEGEIEIASLPWISPPQQTGLGQSRTVLTG